MLVASPLHCSALSYKVYNSFDSSPGLGPRHVVVLGLDALDLAADTTLDQFSIGSTTHGTRGPDQ